LVRIDFVTRGLASNGRPRLDWTYVIIAGPFTGRKFFDHTYLSEDAVWRLQNLAAAAGVQEEFDTRNPAQMINLFCGKQMVITIKPDNYVNREGVHVEDRKVVQYDPLVTGPAEEEREEDHADGASPPDRGEEPPPPEPDAAPAPASRAPRRRRAAEAQ
jgi:hypothetical protein